MTTNSARTFMLTALTDHDFDAFVSSTPTAVLVDFTATWCAPCRALTPLLGEIAAEFGPRLAVVSVDGDASPALARRFGVRAFPTLVVLREGREVARQVGLTTKAKITAMLTGDV